MTTEHDVPKLIRKLAFSIEKSCYMHNVQHPSKRLAALAYETLLGLNEVAVADVEEEQRAAVNAIAVQCLGNQQSGRLPSLLARFDRDMHLPMPDLTANTEVNTVSRTFELTENQAVLSCLVHLKNSVQRQTAPPSDLFIPQLEPFDLTSCIQSGAVIQPHPGAHSMLTDAHKATAANTTYFHDSNPSVAPSSGVTYDVEHTASEDTLRHPFRLLPSALFEQLSDPRMLNSISKSDGGAVTQQLRAGASQQGQQQQAGAGPSSTAWLTDDNQVQHTSQSMQQKPAWLLTNADADMTKADKPARKTIREQSSSGHTASGGMPFGLPLALLQMEAEPGCLTNWPEPKPEQIQSQLRAPSSFTVTRQGSLVPLGSTSNPRGVQQPPPTPASHHQTAGTDSLRSSDEFPSNKENNHGALQSLNGRGSSSYRGAQAEQHIISEQAVAQQAVYALQGIAPSIERLSSWKLYTCDLRAAALGSLVKPLVLAGRRRQALENFVAAFGSQCNHSGASDCDPILQAFAAAVQAVLRSQSLALQQLPQAVQQRRQAESLESLELGAGLSHGTGTFHRAGHLREAEALYGAEPSLGAGLFHGARSLHEAEASHGAEPSHGAGLMHSKLFARQAGQAQTALPVMTVLEVAVHTEKLQAQLATLAGLCWSEPGAIAGNGPGCGPTPDLLPISQHESSQRLGLKATPALQGFQCKWAQQGFPKGPALLSHLYAQLQESDDTSTAALVRFLFLAAWQPFMQHLSSWVYTTQKLDATFADSQMHDSNGLLQLPGPSHTMGPLPQALPSFLQPCSRQFLLAGWQLRILHCLQPQCTFFVEQVGAIAAAEAAEARLAAQDTTSGQGPGKEVPAWGLAEPAGRDMFRLQGQSFPLVFDSQAIQQVSDIRQRACGERMREAEAMLSSLAEQRQTAQGAVDAQVLIRKRQLHNSREAVRARKEEEARQQRLHRLRVLGEQQAAMTAHQARLQADRSLRIREEEEVLKAAARAEHRAATAAVAAAAKAARQDVQQMQKAADRMAWRTQRWRLAAQRRKALEATEAVEDAELPRTPVPAPRWQQPASIPAVATAEKVSAASSEQLGSRTADLASQAQTSIGDGSKPETLQSSTSGDAQSNAASHAAANGIDIATDSQAVSDDASLQRKADSNGVGARSRGRWGQVQQPFIAAGQASSSSDNTTAAVLLGSIQIAQPTDVAEGGSTTSGIAAEVPRTTLDTAEESLHQSSTDESFTAVAPSGQVLETQASALEPQAAADISDTQQPATAVEAFSLTSPKTVASQEPPAATAAAESPHTAATAEYQLPTAAAIATAAGLPATTSAEATRPAAGSYRRVAWAPVQNPFPAAGQSGAVPEQALLSAPQTVGHGAVAEQTLTPAPQTADQSGLFVRQPLPSGPAFESSAQTPQTQQVDGQAPAEAKRKAANLAERFDESGTMSAAMALSVQAASNAAALQIAPQHLRTTQVNLSDDMDQSQQGYRRRHGWTGVVQPFAAAGASTVATTGANAGALGQSTADAKHAAQRDESSQPRVIYARRRWQLEEAGPVQADSAENPRPGHLQQPQTGQGQDEEGLVPLSVAMDACLVQGVLHQYRCVSKACLGFFLDELKIMDLFRCFQRYFFMAAGDWADNFAEALCSSAAQHGMLHEHSVQSMLESSFKSTSAEQDSNAAKARVSLEIPPSEQNPGQADRAVPTRAGSGQPGALPGQLGASQGSTWASPRQSGAFPLQHQGQDSNIRSASINNSQLKALEAVRLSFEVAWPLSLVVTQDALQQYSAIFSWLLCLKRVAVLTTELWSDLKSLDALLHQSGRSRASGLHTDPFRLDLSGDDLSIAQQRLRALQLFRHEAAHLISALQAYTQGQLLGNCWQQLQQNMRGVTDVADLETAHAAYLAQAQHECLMSASTRELRAIMEPALQCVVDFANSFRLFQAESDDISAIVFSSNMWSSLDKQIQGFKLRSSVFYKVLKYANGRGHYQELFVQLNFSDYHVR